MESPQRDPTTPGVRLPACACPRVRLPEQIGRTERGRKTGKTGRQGGQPDTLSRAGSFRPCLPRLPCLPTLPTSHARLPCPVSHHAHLPCLPTFPACRPCPLAHPTPFPAMPACVILSTGAPHAHPAKRPFVKPFYHFPIYQNVTH